MSIREIDPAAEVARLVAERSQKTLRECLLPHILTCSIVQVPPEWELDDERDRIGISIVITSTLPHPLTAGLDARIRDVIWDAMREARA